MKGMNSMIGSMLGIDIESVIPKMEKLAGEAVATLEEINSRLARIEEALELKGKTTEVKENENVRYL